MAKILTFNNATLLLGMIVALLYRCPLVVAVWFCAALVVEMERGSLHDVALSTLMFCGYFILTHCSYITDVIPASMRCPWRK